jgi:stress response protein SCP2
MIAIRNDNALEDIKFDLHWGYPPSGRDFLDASCLAFDGAKNRVDFVDFDHNEARCRAIFHSGDIMDDSQKVGHHIITVHLSRLAPNYKRLYFNLSAWNSPNIGSYPHPAVSLYDEKRPNEQLCDYAIQTAATSQAVVMCYLEKNAGDSWDVWRCGALSAGSVRAFQPIEDTIRRLWI